MTEERTNILQKYRSTDSIYFPEGSTIEEGLRATCIPGSTIERPVAALWNGHQFEAVIGKHLPDSHGVHFYNNFEYHSLIYYPIDPRIIESDVHGAINAYPNDDNTGWLFEHCDANYHLDKELELVAIVESLFQGQVESRLVDCLKYISDTTLGPRSLLKYNNIKTFRDKVQEQVRKGMAGAYLGYFHQNPNASHVSSRIKYALDLVKKEYELADAFGLIRDEYTAVSDALNATHTHETRWDQVARLFAEQKKRDEASESDSES